MQIEKSFNPVTSSNCCKNKS